jgi:hypothetical protein
MNCRQAPAPLHVPSRPQVLASLAGHVCGSRGFVPDETKVHVPMAVGAEHVLQVSVQAPLQQTPSTQKLLAHSAAQPHTSPSCLPPLASLRHTPPGPPSAPSERASPPFVADLASPPSTRMLSLGAVLPWPPPQPSAASARLAPHTTRAQRRLPPLISRHPSRHETGSTREVERPRRERVHERFFRARRPVTGRR